MHLQKFAVLWEGHPDTRVIDLIEQAIIQAVLSPVKILNSSKGMLVVVHDSRLVGENYQSFHNAWEEIAAGAIYDEWTVLLVKDIDAGFGFGGGRIFREFARGILESNEIGISEFTPDMFLFNDEWAPENVFGLPPAEEPEAEAGRKQRIVDLFDEDLDSWRESTNGSKTIP